MADKSLTPIDLPELSSAPASPASGFHRFYAKTDGKAYSKSSAGTEYDLTTGVSLTTTGTSGAATLVGTTLNIPVYQSALTNPVTGTGTSGQVAYWNGTTTQTGSNNLFWDAANNRLGIGLNNPVSGLTIKNSSTFIDCKNTSNVVLMDCLKAGPDGGVLRLFGGVTSTLSGSFYFDGPDNNNAAYAAFGIAQSGTYFGTTGAVLFSSSRNGTGVQLPMRFGGYSNSWTTWMQMATNGNISIGSETNNGQRLQVYGSTLLRGSGTTSATTGLLVQNSTPTANFTIRDDGGYAFRGGTVGLAQTGYTTFTNLTTDRTCDANATTVEELADILGTLIEDLKTKGIISA